MKRACLLLLAACLATPALADVQLRYVVTNSNKPAAAIVVHDGRIRIETSATGQPSAILYEAAKHRFLLIDTANRTYRLVNQRAIRNIRHKIATARRAAAALPDAVRGFIQDKAPAASAVLTRPLPQATVAATGKRANAGGHACDVLTVRATNNSQYGLCVAPAASLAIPEKDAQTLAAMAADLHRFAGRNLILKAKSKALLLKARGVPVKYADFRRGRTYVLDSVTRKSVGDKRVALPRHYQQRPLIDVLHVGS